MDRCKNFTKVIVKLNENIFIFTHALGALAQLARAFDWQSRGHRFDSDMLHGKSKSYTERSGGSFYLYTQLNIQQINYDEKV